MTFSCGADRAEIADEEQKDDGSCKYTQSTRYICG